jgi:predicted RNA polymerase sigma factor
MGRLLKALGRKDEAKAEFDKASSITNAADSALVDKISGGHAKDRPDQQPVAVPQKRNR